MNDYNEVKNPSQLVQGDRIILVDGYADVLAVVETNDIGTTIRANEDGHGELEIYLENTLLLEVERGDS